MDVQINLQNTINTDKIPALSQLQQWINEVKETVPQSFTSHQKVILIRIVDEKESAQLNEDYRHKKGPTNILSFPDDPIPGFDSDSMGELIICAPVMIREAKTQKKNLIAHWAHIIVHGVLHLAGYDHEKQDEAIEMENLEVKILQKLGYDNPY